MPDALSASSHKCGKAACAAELGLAACAARVTGFASTSGSVAGGGLLREVETVVLPADATTIRVEP